MSLQGSDPPLPLKWYVVNLLNWTPIFEQYMENIVVKNGHPKDKFYNKIIFVP